MHTLKKNFLYILLFGLLSININGTYSYAADLYNGRVKYGSYHCDKDGATCDFARFKRGTLMSGDACPTFNKNMRKEVYNKIVADFLNSKYCKYTPSTVTKYNCKYDDGTVTVFMQGDKIVAISNPNNIKRKNIQDFYEPNKCSEVRIESNNNTQTQTPDSTNSNSDFSPQDVNNVPSNDVSINENQQEVLKNSVEQTIKEETEILNEKITSLQKENQNLRNEMNKLKNQIDMQEQYLYYIIIFLAIAFVISFIAIFKSNRNPNDKLL